MLRKAAAAAGTAAFLGAASSAVATCDDAKKVADAKKVVTDTKKADPKSMAELQLGLTTKARRVFVTGGIDDESAKVVIQQLLHLEAEAPGAPISMHIMSGGGKVYAGLAILDVMRSLSSPVHTTCLGHCESMAAVLLACGEPGRRYTLPNARVMIHQPVRGASPSKSSAKEALIQAQAIDQSRLRLCQLLAESTGRPLAELEALMDHDCYCSATEAKELGLVDHVCGKGHFSPARERGGSAAAGA